MPSQVAILLDWNFDLLAMPRTKRGASASSGQGDAKKNRSRPVEAVPWLAPIMALFDEVAQDHNAIDEYLDAMHEDPQQLDEYLTWLDDTFPALSGANEYGVEHKKVRPWMLSWEASLSNSGFASLESDA